MWVVEGGRRSGGDLGWRRRYEKGRTGRFTVSWAHHFKFRHRWWWYTGIGGGVMRTLDKDPIRRSNRSHYGELNATTSPAITMLEKLRYGSGDLNRKGVIGDRFPLELR
ncbi:hypothetical protein L6452_26366 [Arctium lappa]|uniref:Uncharacterized protein n=1 Tax=Arctium lappa TaxID=4217 RepID=A0ACB9ABY3_ARCLA|nr:hypothetical protein L6452_26366 [Arctium lappa]